MVQGDGEVNVVVKFTARYNERAHRMLAERQLASTLHYFGRVLGGLYMVVMDYVVGDLLFHAEIPEDYTKIYRDIMTAVDRLHKENIVFGDLRLHNIIVRPEGGAVLIDFDVAGEHNVDRYPATWNTGSDDEDEGAWAEGVKRYGLMDKKHDHYLLG